MPNKPNTPNKPKSVRRGATVAAPTKLKAAELRAIHNVCGAGMALLQAIRQENLHRTMLVSVVPQMDEALKKLLATFPLDTDWPLRTPDSSGPNDPEASR